MIPIYRGPSAQLEMLRLCGPAGQTDAASKAPRDLSRFNPENPLVRSVSEIIRQVAESGDEGLRRLSVHFGDNDPMHLRLSEADIESAFTRLPESVTHVLDEAADNIRVFAQAVMKNAASFSLERSGFRVGLDFKPVARVGCYVPGGRYPLPSTALMTAMTAHVAGVEDICIVSPSLRDEVVYAGTLAGVREFYEVGGAQAIAALAFGTESIQAVDMVVGPGNAYVTEAKRQLQGVVGIDMLAGPSEVGIIADAGANARWVALDLLAQAEHDPEARAYLWTTEEALANAVSREIEQCLQAYELPTFVRESLSKSGIFVFSTMEECVQAANQLAPEHLELQVEAPHELKPLLKHYGAVFLGYQSTVPFGDYMAGPNHTLPTGRSARYGGSLTPLTFLRPQSWIEAGPDSERLSENTAHFARLEGLTAHAAAASVRFQKSSK